MIKLIKKRGWVLIIITLISIITITPTTAYLLKEYKLDNNVEVAVVTPEIIEIEDGIRVKNIGNVETYVRIQMALYKEDDDGKILIRDLKENEEKILNHFKESDDWIQENSILYYAKPLKVGEETTPLYKNNNEEVEIYAESIQANAAQNAWEDFK